MFKEADYKGKDVELNKPSRGDVKKYKVFVKDPKTGNVKKVNFGDKNMEIKRDDPERRKNFRARHNCDTAKDKTTPRYWSCKFWSSKNVSDLLNEVINPDEVDIASLQFHDELNPLVWDNGIMKGDIRKKLMLNAKNFIEYSDLEDIKFSDVILTGSMANYNYNDFSDFDVHVLFDFSQISENEDFVSEFLKMKKTIWNDKFPIQIKGHDVEMYFQDIDEKHASTGIYSLMKNEWIAKPTKKIIYLDVDNIQSKSAQLMNAIDDLNNLKRDDRFLKKYTEIKEKIKKMRKSGLEREGEYSTENLTFKILRNNGYLEKLMDLKKDYLTSQLSLSEFEN